MLKNFQSTLAKKSTVKETLRPQTRQAHRARSPGPICYVAFSFLHLLHSRSGVWGSGCRALSTNQLYTLNELLALGGGILGGFIITHPGRGTARGVIKSGRAQSSPLRMQVRGWQTIITKEITVVVWASESTQH